MKRNPENTYKNPTPEKEARKAFIQRMLSMPMKQPLFELREITTLRPKANNVIPKKTEKVEKRKGTKKINLSFVVKQACLSKTPDGKIDVEAVKKLLSAA